MAASKEARECVFPVAPKFIDKSGNVKLLDISMMAHDIARSVSKANPPKEGWSLTITTRVEPCMESIVFVANETKERNYHELNRMARLRVLATLFPPDGERLNPLDENKQLDIASSVILKAFRAFGTNFGNSGYLSVNTVPWYGIDSLYDASKK